jgi:cytochrome P450
MAEPSSESSDPRPARVASLRRTLPALLRDPLGTLVELADQAAPDEVLRLNLGSIRPYLVTEPAHVQRVLKDNAANYTRGGNSMMWKSVRRLTGEGVLSEGPEWAASRRRLQPHFTAKRLESVVDDLSRAIGEAVDELAEPARTGQAVDAGRELSRILCHAVIRVFFADKIRSLTGCGSSPNRTPATALMFRC